MTVRTLDSHEEDRWNVFISEQFPPVGAFLQTFEWGEFKKVLHGDVERFVVEDNGAWLACFQMEIHKLVPDCAYGYAPRGPVLRKEFWKDESKVTEMFKEIVAFLEKSHSELMFIRFEPPEAHVFDFYSSKPFAHRKHYLQPRFNQLITISTPEKLMETFSHDIKHDIRAAERLGIYCEDKEELSPEEQVAFDKMRDDTQKRSGKDIFPSEGYFNEFISTFGKKTNDPSKPRLRYFVAKNKDGEAVAINLNILFPHTLTYLYGASYTGSASKRAPACLHWSTMKYALENGYQYYDLGGVDDTLWHGLTYFKRQFGGATHEYVGTVDAVFKPALTSLYNYLKELRS